MRLLLVLGLLSVAAASNPISGVVAHLGRLRRDGHTEMDAEMDVTPFFDGFEVLLATDSTSCPRPVTPA